MYIQLDGQVLLYEKTGEGKPIILLHGNGESHEIYDELAAELESEYTLYAVDSRGQGGSATPTDYHYKDMAQDVINFINSLQIEKPCILGFSDGAIVALLVAMERSDLLSSIILCGANLKPKGLTGSARREIKDLLKKTQSPLVKMMLEEPNISENDLRQIAVPALVCAGDKDMVKPKETDAIAANIPQAKKILFKGATHSSYVEHSTVLAPVVRDFYQA